jgi:hypothetical protein
MGTVERFSRAKDGHGKAKRCIMRQAQIRRCGFFIRLLF